MPSKKAARVGALAEQAAADRYGLTIEGEHTAWCDGRMRDGTPVEIKAADLARDYPRFRVFEKYHRKLQANGGRYVFVTYRRRGRGIQVVKMKRIHASRLPSATWYGAGGHRESQQAKIPVRDVF
jgi:hypothetical protein